MRSRSQRALSGSHALAVLSLLHVLFSAPSVAGPAAYEQHLQAGRWIPALDSVRALARREPAMGQESGRVLSLLGAHRDALVAFETLFTPSVPPALPASSRMDSTRTTDALAEIVRRAREHRIVILNEAHHNASHRAFALQVARALGPLGFQYLACEAFDTRGAALDRLRGDGVPRRDLGVYTGEPTFGAFVREAMSLGYRPVAYESPDVPSVGDFVTDFTRRDSLQAVSLVQQIFSRDPEARVLIYCGYDHAFERAAPDDSTRQVVAMAEWLARWTGQDPLTIDQTVGSAASDTGRASLAWRYARAHGRLGRTPIVMLQPSGRSYVGGHYRDRVDLQVFQPDRPELRGRPGWMAMDGERIAVPVPAALRPRKGRRIIEAFLAHEPADAIPFDRLIVAAGDRPGILWLPPGRYRFVAQDESGVECARIEQPVSR